MSIDVSYERVTVHLSAEGLSKIGTFTGKPDSFAVVMEMDPVKKQKTIVGITETINDAVNPRWTKFVVIDYHFEAIQQIFVELYHSDGSSPNSDLSKHTKICSLDFELSRLMCLHGNELKLPVPSGGDLVVKGESVQNTRDKFVVTFSAKDLANKEGFFSSSDPFLKIARLNEEGTWTNVWQSEKVMNDLNPSWRPQKIQIAVLCNGDLDRPLRIEVFDFEKSGNHEFMGRVETSIRGMLGMNGAPMDIIEPKQQEKKKGYKNSGHLFAKNAYIEENPTFTDFVEGGLEISQVVAIDFTGSNGDPRLPDTLHYINPIEGILNPYQAAITSVGRVLEPYDSDRMYPVYGFGAKIRQPDNQFGPVQHCFPVYGGGLEVEGVDGILSAYKDAIANVALSGPTLLAPVINAACSFAAAANCTQEKQKYIILFVILDGVINDLEAVKAALKVACNQPLSIVAVGVGSADFTGMVQLDGDTKKLSEGRDIFQFVSYSDYEKLGPSFLAKAVLQEIPGQLLQFMASRNIKPIKK